jgi:hypothetical protein
MSSSYIFIVFNRNRTLWYRELASVPDRRQLRLDVGVAFPTEVELQPAVFVPRAGLVWVT